MQARYQHGGEGRFLQQDPIVREIDNSKLESLILDPQRWNSYSYASNNPLKYIDPDGKFNIKTGEVEKGDTLGGITKLINTNYNTNYVIEQIGALNNIKDINKIEIGQNIIPNQKIPDITKSLLLKMKTNSKDTRINNPVYFKNKVKNGGDWDFKNTTEYSSKIYKDGFVFMGKKIESDAPANINYGYVGVSTLWASKKLLFKQAGEAQIAAGTSLKEWQNNIYYGDDPKDHNNILWGMELYKQNK